MQLSVFEAFVIGMLSKAASTILTYPMIRVKTLLLKASEEDKVEQKNLAKNETPPELVPHLVLCCKSYSNCARSRRCYRFLSWYVCPTLARLSGKRFDVYGTGSTHVVMCVEIARTSYKKNTTYVHTSM